MSDPKFIKKDDSVWAGMTYKRYKELNADFTLELTDEEVDNGWHFCYDWDGLLIHKDSPEATVCTCRGNNDPNNGLLSFS